ncbi:MAG TPA: ABC transporter permease [Marmoricola sp.]|nr:ABC transporter permease [Marmoricola sp.]
MSIVRDLRNRTLGPVASGLEDVGRQIAFHGRVVAAIPKALRSYRREVLRLLAEVSLGSGALALIGGTVVVVGFLTASAGIEVALEGYNALGNIGIAALSGFTSAYINTREAAPVVAGIALTATIGAGFTAQLGAMRVSEEIDALEVMAIPSIPYLITTRVIAGLIAVVPLYCVALFMSYGASKLIVTWGYGQSGGTYDHYFQTFLIGGDVLWSLVKTMVMALVVIAICCYYGFTASGGPAGVGFAVGRAVRLSLIFVMVLDLAVGLSVWGSATIHVAR